MFCRLRLAEPFRKWKLRKRPPVKNICIVLGVIIFTIFISFSSEKQRTETHTPFRLYSYTTCRARPRGGQLRQEKQRGKFSRTDGRAPGMLLLKCLSPKIFLFSYLKLHLIEITSAKKFFVLSQRRFFQNFLKTFKFAAILAHHSS